MSIVKTIFLPVLKSLDVMEKIGREGFMSANSVSTGLVKFIAQNIDFESMKRAADEAVSNKRSVEEIKKDVREAVKSSSTVANKVDQLKESTKSSYDKLARRVTTLENK